MEDIFKAITLWLAIGTEAAAALIIGLATIEATIGALSLFLPGASRGGGAGEPADRKEEVRLRLGRWLAVALEFELAVDILRTAVAPTWTEIGQLAAIAVLRTRAELCPPAGDRQGPEPQCRLPGSGLGSAGPVRAGGRA